MKAKTSHTKQLSKKITRRHTYHKSVEALDVSIDTTYHPENSWHRFSKDVACLINLSTCAVTDKDTSGLKSRPDEDRLTFGGVNKR